MPVQALPLVASGLAALGIGGAQQATENLSPEQKLELLKQAGQALTGTSGIMAMKDKLPEKKKDEEEEEKKFDPDFEPDLSNIPTKDEKEEEEKPVVPTSLTVAEEKAKDFFDVVGEYETIDGSIEDYEMAYHGGVGDLGDSRAALSIQQTEIYPDYRMWVEEQAQNFLGDEFKAFRITNTKEVMNLLNNQKKNVIKSYTLNPNQAVRFGYMANEAFMDPITTYPRGDLVIIESPVKSESLVMRGRSEEAEVVTDTTGVSIKNSRIYNPYTGEVIYEPTKGSLVGTEPHKFEKLINTKTQKSSFLDDLKDKFVKPIKKAKGGFIDKPLYDTKKDIF